MTGMSSKILDKMLDKLLDLLSDSTLTNILDRLPNGADSDTQY